MSLIWRNELKDGEIFRSKFHDIPLYCPDCSKKIINFYCDTCNRDFAGHRYFNFLPKQNDIISGADKKNYQAMKDVYEKLKTCEGARKIIADWSITKIEEVNISLVNIIPRKENLNVLEIGPGRGYLSYLFTKKYPKNTYFALEYERNNIDYGFELGYYDSDMFVSLGSIYKLPFEKCYFNVIIVSEVLEHLEYLDTALREIGRVLKPSGYVIASVPNSVMSLYPLQLVRAIAQGLRCPLRNDRGLKLLVRKLRREVNESGAYYHRPFLPGQFKTIFQKYGLRVIKHCTSMFYFYYWPFTRIIERGNENMFMMQAIKEFIKISDKILELNIPVIKYLGARQHILCCKNENARRH